MKVVVLGAALFALAACGSDPPVIPDAGPPTYTPVAVGHVWTYRVTTADGLTLEKVQTVTGTATVDDAQAYVFETRRGDLRTTRSIQLVQDNRLLRASEVEFLVDGSIRARIRYTPLQLRFDSNLVAQDDRYEDMHVKEELDLSDNVIATETRTQTFVVEAEREVVEVPAGSIEAVRIRRSRINDRGVTVEKQFWYAEGVGKVKEVGGQTEELVRFVPGG